MAFWCFGFLVFKFLFISLVQPLSYWVFSENIPLLKSWFSITHSPITTIYFSGTFIQVSLLPKFFKYIKTVIPTHIFLVVHSKVHSFLLFSLLCVFILITLLQFSSIPCASVLPFHLPCKMLPFAFVTELQLRIFAQERSHGSVI